MNSSSANYFNCLFGIATADWYTCVNTNFREHGTISTITGAHLSGKSNKDVLNLALFSDAMTSIPSNIYQTFPNLYCIRAFCRQRTESTCLDRNSLNELSKSSKLRYLVMNGHRLDTVNSKVFHATTNLAGLVLQNNQIKVVYVDAFKGLKRLDTLMLSNNFIKELLPGTFDDLVELLHLSMYDNSLTTLPKDILKFNKKLRLIEFGSNRIKLIDPQLLDNIPEPIEAHFYKNICIDKAIEVHLQDRKGELKAEIAKCDGKYSVEKSAVPSMTGVIKKLKREKEKLEKKILKLKKQLGGGSLKCTNGDEDIRDLLYDIKKLENYKKEYMSKQRSKQEDEILSDDLTISDDEVMNDKYAQLSEENRTLREANSQLFVAVNETVNFMKLENCRYQ